MLTLLSTLFDLHRFDAEPYLGWHSLSLSATGQAPVPLQRLGQVRCNCAIKGTRQVWCIQGQIHGAQTTVFSGPPKSSRENSCAQPELTAYFQAKILGPIHYCKRIGAPAGIGAADDAHSLSRPCPALTASACSYQSLLARLPWLWPHNAGIRRANNLPRNNRVAGVGRGRRNGRVGHAHRRWGVVGVTLRRRRITSVGRNRTVAITERIVGRVAGRIHRAIANGRKVGPAICAYGCVTCG